ncbi:hypothetical protein EUX98_g2226 [Antrodiella citrinella]|uniref:Aminodeoxychorismate lyase n=1 Tax=Antrodiella citrinella TaxID=2447956 RepID=A0A4S4N2B8_9APHY|nr:hypothetical protein EUX98_g2226 [Antrodiella citrinella]
MLLTSARYDPTLLDVDWNTRANKGVPTPVMLLSYHVDRLAVAAEQHGWTQSINKITAESLSTVCETAVRNAGGVSEAAYKMRVLLGQDGSLSATATVLPRPAVPRDLLTPSDDPTDIRTIYLDTAPTPAFLFTRTKTTHRAHYNAARARVRLSPAPTPSDAHIDVLLFTPEGLLMETSIRNIAFKRDGRWVTPHVSTGCLPGVVRRYMIEQGQWEEASEGELGLEDVQEGEIVMTTNGVEGCCLGCITRFQEQES